MKDEGLREKVIKGLECCILRDPDDHARCSQCQYESNCVNRLKMDALELLKEQGPEIVRCKDCLNGAYVVETGMLPFITCGGVDHKLDWFCADGKKVAKWNG